MDFDVVIIGAGPAGLATAIRLAQLNQQDKTPLSICVLEKAASIGAQTLSGAVLEPRALNELIPDWQNHYPFLCTPASKDEFVLLTEKNSFKLPTPPQMRNQGNFIISLGQLCGWLAEQAEKLGVNIFPEFAATEIIYENAEVHGVITGDKGIDKQGNPTTRFQPGIELRAKQTIFAEGCRGSLTQTLFEKFALRKNCDPQTYGLGIKELWEIPEELHQPGKVLHTIGWPLDAKTYGGSFTYHLGKNLLAIGFVIGLDYQNPYLNPYEEFQRFKTHPLIAPLLEKSKRLEYGARCINEGGFQSIPKLTFKGGLIVGCAAGFLNVPKIKGIHNAMKSGMVAAENIYSLLKENHPLECTQYRQNLNNSWVMKELHQVRNIRPAMRWGLPVGLMYAAIDTYLFRGLAPWTLRQHTDHLQLKLAADSSPIHYPKHDKKITFDLADSLYLTHTKHNENQPCHLKLKNPETPIVINLNKYAAPEQRYCPAGVYEIIYPENQSPYLYMHASNCVQCKACDIKDPTQNIVWTPPEGGTGPEYERM
jgi:electron-transferring-flavoprotein dehydrogenase